MITLCYSRFETSKWMTLANVTRLTPNSPTPWPILEPLYFVHFLFWFSHFQLFLIRQNETFVRSCLQMRLENECLFLHMYPVGSLGISQWTSLARRGHSNLGKPWVQTKKKINGNQPDLGWHNLVLTFKLTRSDPERSKSTVRARNDRLFISPEAWHVVSYNSLPVSSRLSVTLRVLP